MMRAPASAFSAERDLDPQRPQEWLGATKPAGERPRVSGPAIPAEREAVKSGARTNEVRRAPRPGGATRHELADTSCHRIGIEDARAGCPAVLLVGAKECPRRMPLTCHSPLGEVGHARRSRNSDIRKRQQSVRERIEERAQDGGPRELEIPPQLPFRSPPALR